MKKTTGFISREKFYDALAIAAGGALLLGLSQGFNKVAQPPIPPDFSDFVEVETLTNSKGQSVIVSILHREEFERWRRSDPITDANVLSGDVTDMVDPLSLELQSRGLSEGQATTAAMGMAAMHVSPLYLPLKNSGTPFVGLSPRALPERGEDYSIYACSIAGVSQAYDGADWVRGFLETPRAKINLPYDYAPEFNAFALNHERAHCMGANEAQADAAAARLLLKHHPDQNRARAFLALVSDIRIYREIYEAGTDAGKEYGKTALALERVLQQHEQSGRVDMTEAQIWTLAAQENFDSDPQRARAMQIISNNLPPLFNHEGFSDAASRLRAIGENNRIDANLIARVERTLDHLASVISPSRQPAKPKPTIKSKPNT